MPVNLVKLCVGATSIEDLAQWQETRIALRRRQKLSPHPFHTTFQMPKRSEDLLAGGSLYWVIKGFITVRQRLVALEEGTKDDGKPCAVLVLDTRLVPVRPVPRRAFQGWRYLDAADAPPDLTGGVRDDTADMPARMRRDLSELGLL